MNTPSRQNFEYDFVAVNDRHGGGVNLPEITAITANHARDGWRLVTVFTNELGKNAVSVGGFGINSTMDQTILVFEREIIRALPEPEEKTFRADALITHSNITAPFIPKGVTFAEKNGGIQVTLRAYAGKSFNLQGLQGDLVVRNVLGDEALLEDVCFFSFEKVGDNYLISTPFPVTLPPKISYGVSTAGLIVKRYIGNDGLVIPESLTLDSIAEVQLSNAKSMNLDTFLSDAEALENAEAIHQLMTGLIDQNPSVFSPEVMERMNKFVKMEKMYGNAKSGVMRFLKQYFEEIGLSSVQSPAASGKSAKSRFLFEAAAKENAAEIHSLMVETAKIQPDLITDVMMERMEKFLKMEQMYGNAKSGVMRFLRQEFGDNE